MSEDKDDLKSIKVYKFNNTKEGWHEFALKFRVIADSRGYDDIIKGMETPPDEKQKLEITDKDNVILHGTAQSPARMLILLKKMSKTGNLPK